MPDETKTMWLCSGQFHCDAHKAEIPFYFAPMDATCAECSNNAPESYFTPKVEKVIRPVSQPEESQLAHQRDMQREKSLFVIADEWHKEHGTTADFWTHHDVAGFAEYYDAERDRELQQVRGELSDLTALLPSRDKQSFEAGFEAGKELFELELREARKRIEARNDDLQLIESLQDHVIKLSSELSEAREELARLRLALTDISEGRGRFSLDHHQHAMNTIEDMKNCALTALAVPEKPDTQ